MNPKTTYVLTIATIAIAAATLAISPIVTNPAFASVQGRGHEEVETCTTHGETVEGDCKGNSERSPQHTETDITTPGKSGNLKNEKDRTTNEEED